MLVFIGDIHGNFDKLRRILAMFDGRPATFIQVGDFGFYPNSYWREEWDRAQIMKRVYFIDGNHDHVPHLLGISEVTEVWPNAVYVPRGTILELDSKRIGFLGGAASVDAKWRTAGMDWFPEEQIRQSDVDKLKDQKVDILVTHTPPNFFIQNHFDQTILETYFELPRTWRDPSAFKVEDVWMNLNKPQLICGHMHRSIRQDNIILLNVNETCVVE